MLALVVSALVVASPELECVRAPASVERLGPDTVGAWREHLQVDPKAPAVKSAPADARLLLRLIWTAAAEPSLVTLGALMEPAFTWSFGGDASAEQALASWRADVDVGKKLRAAVAGRCRVEGTTLTCAPKRGPRLVLERLQGCWRWTAFVAGD